MHTNRQKPGGERHRFGSVRLSQRLIAVCCALALVANSKLAAEDIWQMQRLPPLAAADTGAANQLWHVPNPAITNPPYALVPSIPLQPATDLAPGLSAVTKAIDHRGYAPACESGWRWQILPDQLIYQTYLASVTAPRMGAVFNVNEDGDWKWDLAIGGRIGLLRYGNHKLPLPQGWQLDVEAAAFPRLTPIADTVDLEATDYRFGIPVSYGTGRYQMKIAYFHLSSHLGDEWAIRQGLLGSRINYSRDAIVWGHSYMATDNLRLYAEFSWAFKTNVSRPWHYQFGCEYSQLAPTGVRGAPFFATNLHLRQENNFGGRAVIQAGWQWTKEVTERRLRLGIQYYNGNHEKYQFFQTSEQKFGFGIWYDF